MIKSSAAIVGMACLVQAAGAQIYDIRGIQLTHDQMAGFYGNYGDRYALTSAGPRPVDGHSVLRVSGRVTSVLPDGWLGVLTAEGRSVVVRPRLPRAYADGDAFFGAGVRTGVHVVTNVMGMGGSTRPLVTGGELSWKEFVDAARKGEIPLPPEYLPSPSAPPKPSVMAPQGFRIRKRP